MLSRVADALYWVGRYIERAENTARFVEVNLTMSLDAPIAFSNQWEPLIAITASRERFGARYDAFTRDNVIEFLTSDRANASSIVSCITSARENARSVRDVLSSEAWEQINRFYLMVSNRGAAWRALNDSFSYFSDVKLLSHLISGVADNTMSNGQAWHFFHLGRFMERADNTTRLLDVKYFLLLPSVDEVGGPVDEMQWAVVLRSATAFEMYRKRFGAISPENVIDFLLLETEFPRAVLFCLSRAEEALHAISGTPSGMFQNPAEQHLGRLRAELAYMQVYDIIAKGLHEFLDNLQGRMNDVGSAIAETFFGIEPRIADENGLRGKASSDVLSGDQSQRWLGGNSGYTSNLR